MLMCLSEYTLVMWNSSLCEYGKDKKKRQILRFGGRSRLSVSAVLQTKKKESDQFKPPIFILFFYCVLPFFPLTN